MRLKSIVFVAGLAGVLLVSGCDSSTSYSTTIEGTALPSFETGTAVKLYLTTDAATAGQLAVFEGRVAGQSQGWLILDRETDRQVISASAIARVELAKPTSTSKPPAAPVRLPPSPATDASGTTPGSTP